MNWNLWRHNHSSWRMLNWTLLLSEGSSLPSLHLKGYVSFTSNFALSLFLSLFLPLLYIKLSLSPLYLSLYFFYSTSLYLFLSLSFPFSFLTISLFLFFPLFHFVTFILCGACFSIHFFLKGLVLPFLSSYPFISNFLFLTSPFLFFFLAVYITLSFHILHTFNAITLSFISLYPTVFFLYISSLSLLNFLSFLRNHSSRTNTSFHWSISTTCLCKAFTCADPKSTKRQSSHQCLFALLGSACLKAAS